MAEPADFMLQFAAVILIAKVFAELAKRNHQPEVVGELLAGIGLSLFAFIDPDEEFFLILAEIGAAFLLFEVGLETDIESLIKVGKQAGFVAILGVIFPFIFGFIIGILIGESTAVALFIGAAFTATSVGISIRVLAEWGLMGTVETRTVLGAAVIDDVLALFVLTIVIGLEEKGSVSLLDLAWKSALILAFFIIFVGVGLLFISEILHHVSKMEARRAILVFAVSACFISFFLATSVGIAGILGAFVAGLLFAKTEQRDIIQGELSPIADVFVPIFFVMMGLRFDFGSLLDLFIVAVSIIMLLIAIVSKLGGCFAGAIMGRMTPKQGRTVGICMIPRGELGLIIAAFGLSSGVFSDEIFSAVLLMVIGTTLITPILIKQYVITPPPPPPQETEKPEPPPPTPQELEKLKEITEKIE
ncbi:MAG: cation:proton antiporter, partial [Candidatus Hodarchaeota archaeon]